jgi:general stress protein 26
MRNGVGPTSRAMAVAKRTGPDFLFLANANSQKFDDLESNVKTQVIFHNSSNQDWICVSGDAVTTSNDDPRIKEVWSKGTAAWFGDLGDGVHNGKPEDPRMKLIEVRANCE